MWDIQPDWKDLKSFYVCFGKSKYQIVRNDGILSCTDSSVQVDNLQKGSFTISTKEGQCSFIAPKKIIQIHKGNSINCVDISPNGNEILSGDSKGKLFLTYIGTEPVPLEGPTEDFDVEDCIFDPSHKLFFSCGGDFRIYEFSATEYTKTNRFDGHRSSVKHLDVKGDYLFSGSYDSTIIQWDINQKQKVTTFQIGGRINDFCFTNNNVIISATESSLVAVDLKTGLPSAAPNTGNSGSASFNSISSFNNDIVTCTDEGEVIIWDIRNTDTPAGKWRWYDSPINKVRYTNNGRLFSLSNDGTTANIDVREQKSLALLGTQAYAPAHDIAFNDVSAWVADGEGRLYNFDL